MKLQTKFLFLSGVSLICALILSFTTYHVSSKTADFPRNIELIQAALFNQSYRASTSYAIQADIWKGAYANNQGQKNEVTDAIDSVNEHLKIYRESIHTDLALNLSAELDRNIEMANDLFASAANKSQNILNDINEPDFKFKLQSLNGLFKQADLINDSVYYQLIDAVTKLKHEVRMVIQNVIRTSIAIAIFLIILICLVPIFSYYNLFAPMAQIINIMHIVQKNGSKDDIPFTNRSDEIGDIAQALEVFSFNSYEMLRLEEKARIAEENSHLQQHSNMLIVANSFEQNVKRIVDTVAVAAIKMDETAKILANTASSTKKETQQIATSSSISNNSIQVIAKAIEEFSHTANQIAQQVSSSDEYAKKASQETSSISETVTKFEAKAKAIDSVMTIINDIVSQIELLALNATIEAARAGDAGRGFAVVASEVKALAIQTAKATEEVSNKINEMQASASKAVIAVKEISSSVITISDNSASITSSIDKQNKSTADIAANLANAASMSTECNHSIAEVSKSTAQSELTVSQLVTASSNLTLQSTMLQSEVDKFLSSLKKA